MKLDATLYSFSQVFLNTFMKHEPVYVSPKSTTDIGSVSDCFLPTYDAFDSDCPNVKKRIHPRIVPVTPLGPMRPDGRTKTDLLWGGEVSLITKEGASAFAAEGFTGLEFRPVDLFRDAKCKKPVEGFLELHVTERVPIDLERSGVTIKYACPLCDFTRYSSWDGAKGLHFEGEYDEWPDVFRPRQEVVSAIMVKTRFAQLMVDLGLRPFMLVRLEDMKPFKAP